MSIHGTSIGIISFQHGDAGKPPACFPSLLLALLKSPVSGTPDRAKASFFGRISGQAEETWRGGWAGTFSFAMPDASSSLFVFQGHIVKVSDDPQLKCIPSTVDDSLCSAVVGLGTLLLQKGGQKSDF